METSPVGGLQDIGVNTPILRAPMAHLRLLRSHRFLMSNLVRREVRGRFKNAYLGYAWTVIEPAMLAVVYYFLFSLLSGNDDILYAVWVLIGVIVWSCFGKTLQATVGSLTRNASMIHLVHFPRAIFPLTSTVSNIILSLLSSLVVLPLLIVFDVSVTWRLVFVPVAIGLAAAQAIGLGMLLAPFNCVQQDVEHMVRFIVRAGFFLSPVMWTWEMAVERGGLYADIILINPMVLPITLARHGFEGTPLDMGPEALVFCFAWTVVMWVIGSMVFASKERGAVKHL